jgi:hypothetical protein
VGASNRPVVAECAADGTFSVWGAVPSTRLTFGAYASGYFVNNGINAIDIGPPGSTVPELNIEVAKQPELDFMVQDAATSEPIPGAELVWVPVVEGHGLTVPSALLAATCPTAAKADALGRIHAMYPREAFDVVVRADKFAPRLATMRELGHPDAVIGLDQGGALVVHVVESDTPRVGVPVQLLLAPAPRGDYRMEYGMPDSLRAVLAIRTSGDGGDAVFSNLPAAEYTVRVNDRERASETREAHVTAGQTCTVVLSCVSAASISGTVSRDGMPRNGIIIEARSDVRRVYGTTSDSQGAYAFDSLPPGRYTLVSLVAPRSSTGAASHETSSQDVTLESGEHRTIYIEEKPTTRLSGCVRVNGRPMPGLAVEFQVARGTFKRPYPKTRNTTDQHGKFELDAETGMAGTLSIVDTSDGLIGNALAIRKNVSPNSADSRYDFEIDAGRLKIEAVSARSNKPALDVVLRVRPDKDRGGVPGCDGYWSFTGTRAPRSGELLPVGSYLIEPDAADGSGSLATFTIARDAVSRVQVAVQ